MTSLEDLTRLVPPPATPPATDWNAVEALLGTQLPDDYKQLADTYGPGAFNGFIRLYHPHGPTEWVDLTGPMPARLRSQLETDQASGTYPMPHAPEDLFAVGVTDNGNHIFWITTPWEEPDVWRVTVNQADGHAWYTYDGNLASFLVSLLTGHTHPSVFPDDLLSNGAFFTPSRPAGDSDMPTRNPTGTTSRGVIREWARSQGYDVPDRGRIPGHVIQAWEQAH
ncbi:histone-like nucleoid-structuring protein Lsr2 [Streptomyces sp. NPDC090093]|uniref:Lsr2 family DNA-binding protein n=1 Tax=Streptomyces sp. NPDC090093 TaxID=3365945 RepID=UPI0037F136C7